MFGKKQQFVDVYVFAVRDSKGETFGMPMFAQNSLSMIRELEAMMTDSRQQDNFLVTHSDDYTLFEIGTYDRRTGTLVGHEPQSVIGLYEIKSSANGRKASLSAVPSNTAQ